MRSGSGRGRRTGTAGGSDLLLSRDRSRSKRLQRTEGEDERGEGRRDVEVVVRVAAAVARDVERRHHLNVVKRSETGEFGGAWLQGHGLSVGSEVMGLSLRVLRAASSRQMQPDEPVVVSYGPIKTATLSVLRHQQQRHDDARRVENAEGEREQEAALRQEGGRRDQLAHLPNEGAATDECRTE